MLMKIINILLSPETINKSVVDKFSKSTQPNQPKTFTVRCVIILFKIAFISYMYSFFEVKLQDYLSLELIEKQDASLLSGLTNALRY